jgi:hypothetical protein
MKQKYNLSEQDLIKIKNKYGTIPNANLLQLLDNKCSVGILKVTAKKLGVRKNRNDILSGQRTETYDKILEVFEFIKNKKANSLEHATEEVGIHISTFLNGYKKYPNFVSEMNSIDWKNAFSLYCSDCKCLLNESNFRRFNNIKTSKGANQNRLRRCDVCYKSNNKNLTNNFKSKIGRIFSAAKARAENKGWDFDITKDVILTLWDIQNGKCFYTKEDMSYHYGSPDMISIDRIDSSKGYTTDNICLTRWEINRLKVDFPIIRFLEICKKITENVNNTHSPLLTISNSLTSSN